TTSISSLENLFFYLQSTGSPSSSLGNQFTSLIFFKNGTIVQKDFSLENCNLGRDCPLSFVTVNINESYNNLLIDKIKVCSKACSLICNEIKAS
ncbi:MAG: hypothetical protein ACP5JK_03155, partial [Candidatus Aenigmatarchaeota archaeon]